MCSLVGVRGAVDALAPDILAATAALAGVRVPASAPSSSFSGRPGEQGCSGGGRDYTSTQRLSGGTIMRVAEVVGGLTV